MIPLPQMLSEVVMALGGALFAANAWALVRPRVRPGAAPVPPGARRRVLVNAIIGFIVLVWGFATLVARG